MFVKNIAALLFIFIFTFGCVSLERLSISNEDTLWMIKQSWSLVENYDQRMQLNIQSTNIRFSSDGGHYIIFTNNNEFYWPGDRVNFAIVDCYFERRECELFELEYVNKNSM